MTGPTPASGPTAFAGRPVGQVGILVDDLEASCRRYSALWGCGPWRLYTYGPSLLSSQTYRGEPATYSARIAINSTQPQIELIQPLVGPTIYDEFLERGGEGVHHLCAHVDDADAAIATMAAAGYPVIQDGRGFGLDGDGVFAYFDTERELGTVLEVVQVPARRHEPELVIP